MSFRTAATAALFTTMLAAAGAQTASPGAFTFARADWASDAGARGMVTADFDNDGAPDFATVNSGTNTVDVFMNREFVGSGFSVRRYPVGAGPFDVTVSDFNYDSYPDLVVAAADADEIDVLFGGPGGVFQAPVRIAAPGNPRGVAVGYFGSGGYSIVYSSYNNGTISFLDYDYNTAIFTHGATLTAGANPQGIAIGQFKATPGYPDIVVANAGSSQMSVFYNSSGTFSRSELTAPSGARGTHLNVVVAADFNKDGRTDIAAASTANNYVALWMNSSSGLRLASNFTGGVSSPRGMVAADLNVDGRPELIVANRASNSVTIFTADTVPQVFSRTQSVTAGSGSRAVAAADFDGDGLVDLATGNEYASAATVLSNRTISGGGTGGSAFELRALPDVTPDSWVMGGPFAVADFNGNGKPDVVVGDGVVLDGITAVKTDAGRQSSWVNGAAAADFNEDGKADYAQIISYHASDNPWTDAVAVDCLIGDGTGHFTLGASIAVNSAAGLLTGDFNRDGHADIVLLDQTAGGRLRKVFLGRGNGTFVESDQPMSNSVSLVGTGDINGDGTLDLAVWDSSTQQIGILLGNGTGGFPTETVTATVGGLYGAHVADLNGDGRADVVAVGLRPTLIAWLGRSDGTLSAPAYSDLPESAYNLAVADFTGDGHPDVLTSEGTLAVGNGDGTFGMNRNINVTFTDARVADSDRDGLPDLFIGTYYYTAMALYNRAVEPPNAAPIAKVWPHDITTDFASQFGEDGLSLDATKLYASEPRPALLFVARERSGDRKWSKPVAEHGPRHAHRDARRTRQRRRRSARHGDGHDQAVRGDGVHTAYTSATYGAWTRGDDSTAADGAMVWHPNANAAKLASPLASPVNYFDVSFPADPTEEYKLWIRMKAQGNSAYDDSVFVQFEDTVDGGRLAGVPDRHDVGAGREPRRVQRLRAVGLGLARRGVGIERRRRLGHGAVPARPSAAGCGTASGFRRARTA